MKSCTKQRIRRVSLAIGFIAIAGVPAILVAKDGALFSSYERIRSDRSLDSVRRSLSSGEQPSSEAYDALRSGSGNRVEREGSDDTGGATVSTFTASRSPGTLGGDARMQMQQISSTVVEDDESIPVPSIKPSVNDDVNSRGGRTSEGGSGSGPSAVVMAAVPRGGGAGTGQGRSARPDGGGPQPSFPSSTPSSTNPSREPESRTPAGEGGSNPPSSGPITSGGPGGPGDGAGGTGDGPAEIEIPGPLDPGFGDADPSVPVTDNEEQVVVLPVPPSSGLVAVGFALLAIIRWKRRFTTSGTE